jgi:Fic family protein
MTGEGQAPAAGAISSADRLYRSFPEFRNWGRLGHSYRDLLERFSAELDRQRAAAGEDAFDRAVRVAMRAAAIDTGAIEGLYEVDRGFTMSIALQAFAWEHALAERGEGVRELFEAQLAGYELALDVVTRQMPLSEAWLRTLHEHICAPQATYRVLTDAGWQAQELPKGRYKEHPNHVLLSNGSLHAYAPVSMVAPEMRRLFEQLRTTAFEEAHPVEQATYAHHALTVVHPFADGNGRVARALASVYLYRGFSIPLVVFANQRRSYLDALSTADSGEPDPWLEFVADRAIDTLQLVTEGLRSATVPQPDEVAKRVGTLFRPRGRSHGDLDNLAHRLLDEAEKCWKQALADLRPPVGANIARGTSMQPAPAGYRRIAGSMSPCVTVTLATPGPAPMSTGVSFRVNIALDEQSPFGFQLETLGAQDNLEIREADLDPEVGESLKLRLNNWTRRLLGTMLSHMEEVTKEALRRYV